MFTQRTQFIFAGIYYNLFPEPNNTYKTIMHIRFSFSLQPSTPREMNNLRSCSRAPWLLVVKAWSFCLKLMLMLLLGHVECPGSVAMSEFSVWMFSDTVLYSWACWILLCIFRSWSFSLALRKKSDTLLLREVRFDPFQGYHLSVMLCDVFHINTWHSTHPLPNVIAVMVLSGSTTTLNRMWKRGGYKMNVYSIGLMRSALVWVSTLWRYFQLKAR